MSNASARPALVHLFQHVIARAIDGARVDFRARLVACTEGGADAAAWRLALRILPELDTSGWSFDAGWRCGRWKETVGDLDDVIAAGLASAGAGKLADAAIGDRRAIDALAEATVEELARRGIRPGLRAVAAE